MLHIKYKVDKSYKHGLGLIALQNIKIGDVIYTASPLLDLNLPYKEFDKLNDREKDEVKYWGFKIESEKIWHVDFDMSKFINHSFDANTTQDFTHEEDYLVAIKDIKFGEELTQNYLEFETEDDLKRRGIYVV